MAHNKKDMERRVLLIILIPKKRKKCCSHLSRELKCLRVSERGWLTVKWFDWVISIVEPITQLSLQQKKKAWWKSWNWERRRKQAEDKFWVMHAITSHTFKLPLVFRWLPASNLFIENFRASDFFLIILENNHSAVIPIEIYIYIYIYTYKGGWYYETFNKNYSSVCQEFNPAYEYSPSSAILKIDGNVILTLMGVC